MELGFLVAFFVGVAVALAVSYLVRRRTRQVPLDPGAASGTGGRARGSGRRERGPKIE